MWEARTLILGSGAAAPAIRRVEDEKEVTKKDGDRREDARRCACRTGRREMEKGRRATAVAPAAVVAEAGRLRKAN